MALSFEEKLRNYAKLGLVYGLGIDQKARPLYIEQYEHEDHGGLVATMAAEAYALGVPTVDTVYRNPAFERAQFLGAPDSHKLYLPRWVSVRAQEIVDSDGARIAFSGNGDLGIMDDVPSQYPSGFKSAYMQANQPLTGRRMNMLQPWSLFNVPTNAWANKLGMSIEELWEFLFMVTGADRPDCIEYAQGISRMLRKRAMLLNDLAIHTLLFVGEGTHLKVGLSPRARWLGGQRQTPDGTWFGANWPQWENYTTPDWRLTEGTVRVTMPSSLSGPIVDGLSITFQKGRIVSFTATQGAEAFQALINTDLGAVRAGEIAIVDLRNNSLSKFRKPHFSILLDENKLPHLAIGGAYPAALEGGATASPQELADLRCNTSKVHHDLMIGDETISVYALDAADKIVTQLVKDGNCVGDLAMNA